MAGAGDEQAGSSGSGATRGGADPRQEPRLVRVKAPRQCTTDGSSMFSRRYHSATATSVVADTLDALIKETVASGGENVRCLPEKEHCGDVTSASQ